MPGEKNISTNSIMGATDVVVRAHEKYNFKDEEGGVKKRAILSTSALETCFGSGTGQ